MPAVLCSLLLALAPVASAEQSLAALLQQLTAEGEVHIAGATVYDLPVTQKYYRSNAYATTWTNPLALQELAASIEQAEREGMQPEDYHQRQVQGLRDESLTLGAVERDLLLTDALVRLTYHYAFGKVDPRDYISSWNFDRQLPDVDPVSWATEVIHEGGISAGLERLKPGNALYARLVQALADYRALAATGGWNGIDPGATLREGDFGPRVVQLRQRLRVEGDLTLETRIAPERFDATLAQAAARFQRRHHLEDDGIVGKQTLAALNVSAEQRIDQIRVNLERARMLQDIPDTAVIVDIAGFEVSLFRNGQRLLRSRAQVGRPYRSTPVFYDSITYIEFNPTWTVPPSILTKDVLPAIKRDPGYLETKNMQVLTMGGAVVDPATVDWQRYPREGFPYMLRQQPGPDNSLGRLKIMFPNEHMVYLHDTPSRDLFKRSERTFSSGCIRVEEVMQLAELLLDDPAWDESAIAAVIASAKTRRVSLREPMPIYLVYWTVQLGDDGGIEFKRDPYRRDADVLEALQRPLKPDPVRLNQHQPGLAALRKGARQAP